MMTELHATPGGIAAIWAIGARLHFNDSDVVQKRPRHMWAYVREPRRGWAAPA